LNPILARDPELTGAFVSFIGAFGAVLYFGRETFAEALRAALYKAVGHPTFHDTSR
jgi:hypothetical protein